MTKTKIIVATVLVGLYFIGNLSIDKSTTTESYGGVSVEDQLAINKCYDRTGDYASCYAGHKTN
tara:strand:+ start:241 stop:432 length:192 start_codon:yes stop_codon:yes gene_type:complete